MKITQELSNFIEIANKNRKYADNTATGYKVALKKFAEVLNDDEGNSLQLIEERFPQITAAFFEHYKNEMTSASIDNYRKRIQKIINDYKKWGSSMQNWSNWVVPIIKRKSKNSHISNNPAGSGVVAQAAPEPTHDAPVAIERQTLSTRFEIPLRPGVVSFVSTPLDMTKSEGEKIKKYIDYLISIAKEG